MSSSKRPPQQHLSLIEIHYLLYLLKMLLMNKLKKNSKWRYP